MSDTPKKKNTVLGIIVAVLAVIALALVIVQFVVIPKAKHAVAQKLVDQVVEEAIKANPENEEAIKKAAESMDEEDVAAVEQIIEKKIEQTDISEVSGLISSGDTEALKKYANDNFTPEEKTQLLELYSKYQNPEE